MNNAILQLVLVEDDLDFQYLIRQTVEKEADMRVLACCTSAKAAVALADAEKPDLILMDLSLNGSLSSGIEACRAIRMATDCKVLIFTSFEDPDIVIQAAVRGLAHGYVFKSQFALLTEMIRSTATGPTPQQMMIQSLILACLSPAERSVFDNLMGKDVSLHSSPKTIANQKTMILKKLDLPSVSTLIHIFRGS